MALTGLSCHICHKCLLKETTRTHTLFEVAKGAQHEPSSKQVLSLSLSLSLALCECLAVTPAYGAKVVMDMEPVHSEAGQHLGYQDFALYVYNATLAP